MIDMEFAFEKAPWDALLSSLNKGARLSGTNLLAVLEGEDDDTVDEAFAMLTEKQILLDITSLPKTNGDGQLSRRLRVEADFVKEGMDPRKLEETDPLRLYLEEIAGTPAAGEESLLAVQAAQGNEEAYGMLLTLALSRVVELAQEYTDRGVLLLDLIQEGSLGLWQGLQNVPERDYEAFRDLQIRNAMCKAVIMQARSSGIGQKIHRAMQDYRSVDERLLSDLGRNPTLAEIAAELHMSLEETEIIRKMLEDAYLQNQTANDNAQKEPEPEDDQAVEDTAYFQMRQRIQELLSGLSDLDAKILTLRFGLEKGLPMSPEETGRKLGLTSDEVSKREAAALMLLRSDG